MSPAGSAQRQMRAAIALLALLLLAGCGGTGSSNAPATATGTFSFVPGDAVDGQPVGRRFTCDGPDVSPALRWRGRPAGTRSLALVVEDPDAPGHTFTHWLVYGLSPDVTSIASNVPPRTAEWHGTSMEQGVNDFGRSGYSGPCPPPGERHGYVFRLFALDTELALPAGADRASFDRAADGHTVAETRLVASYSRPGDSTNGG